LPSLFITTSDVRQNYQFYGAYSARHKTAFLSRAVLQARNESVNPFVRGRLKEAVEQFTLGEWGGLARFMIWGRHPRG
jgi:hypothetical protein